MAKTGILAWVLCSSSPPTALRIDAKAVRTHVRGLHFVSNSMLDSMSSHLGTFVL